MEFIKDKDGNIFELRDSTINHIRNGHRIANPIEFVKDVLASPDAIIESLWFKPQAMGRRNHFVLQEETA